MGALDTIKKVLNPSQLESTTTSSTKQRNGRLKKVFEQTSTDTDLVTGEVMRQTTRQKTKTNRRGKTKTKLKTKFETYDSDGNLTNRQITKNKSKK